MWEAGNLLWESTIKGLHKVSDEIPKSKVFAEGITSLFDIPKKTLSFSEAEKEANKIINNQSRYKALINTLWLTGAKCTPVEDPELYKQAYDQLTACQNFINNLNRFDLDEVLDNKYQETAENLIKQVEHINNLRDEYVIRAINNNLFEDEQGILIFGFNHKIIEKLPKDIAITFVSPETKEFWSILNNENLEINEAAIRFVESYYRGGRETI